MTGPAHSLELLLPPRPSGQLAEARVPRARGARGADHDERAAVMEATVLGDHVSERLNVVVDEQEDIPACFGRAQVARYRRTARRPLFEHAHRKGKHLVADCVRSLVRATVGDHDYFVRRRLAVRCQ